MNHHDNTDANHADPTTLCQECLQLRLFSLGDVDDYRFVDELAGWSLTSIRALALDPDVSIRRLAARSNMNLDARLQRTLCTDPDLSVVLTLLGRVDPGVEMVELIAAGPHVAARRDLARRNLTTPLLQLLAGDDDDVVRELAQARLVMRGVPVDLVSEA
jgi:hypothetical protein